MADPIRLRDPRSSATRELRELLAAGRSETPDPERLRGMASRLGFAASAVPGGAKLLAKISAGGLGFAGATKVGALVLVLAAGAGVAAMRGGTVPTSNAAIPRATPTVEAPPAPPSADVEPAPAPEPAVSLSPAPSIRKDSPRVEPPSRPAVAAPPLTPAVSALAQATIPPSAPLGLEAPPSTWGTGMPLTPEAPVDAEAFPDAGPVEEAQRELASNPSRALYLAMRDEKTSGGLVEERDLVIIEALVRLGRLDEARDRAARFLRVFPGSAHRAEIAAPFGFDWRNQNP